MTNEPNDDNLTGAGKPNEQIESSRTPFERSQFGGTERQSKPFDEDLPISRSDLRRGAQELSENSVAHINWSVLIISSIVIVAFSLWAIFMPASASTTMKTVVDWIATNLGWYYVITMVMVIGFVLWVALSKEGSVRLGPDDSRPQYKLGT